MRSWLLGGVGALVLHSALVTGMLSWPDAPEPPIGMPPPAILMDLTAPNAAPASSPAPPQPAPEPEPEPEQRVEPEPVTPPEPVVEPPPRPPEVALPKPEPRQKPKAKPPEPVSEPVEQMQETAPESHQSAPSAKAETSSREQEGADTPVVDRSVVVSFQQRLLAHLERHKRYPRIARRLRQEGTAYLRFTMDRDGRVMDYRLERSSGHEALDDEVRELIQRAQPLPRPPAEMGNSTLEMIVPVQFTIR